MSIINLNIVISYDKRKEKMKRIVKSLGIVLIGFSVTLGIMYVNSRGSKSNEINSKQMAVFIEEDGKYKVSKQIPTSGYEFNEERSFCIMEQNLHGIV